MAKEIDLNALLKKAIKLAEENTEGKPASYIPELASVPVDLTQIAVCLPNGETLFASNDKDSVDYKFTLQSVSKLVILIGLLEEFGAEKVFSWVKQEPSGDDFASIARLDQFGPKPSNPMLNSGAITLCSRIPGASEQRLNWIEKWVDCLFGTHLSINSKVFESERRTGDRNRSIAYLLKSTNMLKGEVDPTLDTYFYLCSVECTIQQAAYLPMLLANAGVSPITGETVFSKETAQQVLALMATCGLYDESGAHLVNVGLPAKSGVSGLILASSRGKAGIATMSPRLNRRGTSVRSSIMLEFLSKAMDWHIAS